MISKNAAAVAISTATEFDRRRLQLIAVSGTPLAALVACSAIAEVVATPVTIAESLDYVADPEMISALASGLGNTEEPSQHDTNLLAFSSEIAAAVAQHLNLARNVVRPVISELVEAVTADIEALPVDVQYERAIVQKGLPEPMTSAAFADMIDEFKDVTYDAISTYVGLGEASGAEVIENLVTGAADTDELIAAWAARLGDPFFARLWCAVFTANGGADRFDTLIQDDRDGLDYAIGVFLLCKRLYDNPGEGAVMSLVDFNSKIAELRNQAALRIGYGYDSHARQVRTGQLVLHVADREITVQNEVYAKWIAEGGSNAVLFGSVLSNRPVRFVGELNEKAAEYKDGWERTNSVLTAAERNKRFVRYKTILRERGEKVIGDNMATIFGVTAEEGESINRDTPAVAKAIALVDEFVDGVRENEYKDIWLLCTQLVCRTAFYYTDAEKILLGIDRACKDNPGIAIREAALISAIEYVADYVADQIAISGF